jgi:acetyl-CoA C-acetyltransferase
MSNMCRHGSPRVAANRGGSFRVGHVTRSIQPRLRRTSPPVTGGGTDAERIPVVIASGQSIERGEPVSPIDLMERACEAAFSDTPGLRHCVDRLSVVDVMTRTGPAPATELARRLGMTPSVIEVTTIGGNSPQWLVSRAATDIAEGSLAMTVIAGAEGIRSSRARRDLGMPRDEGDTSLPPDLVVGDDLPGIGPAESAIGLMAPVHVYPLFESVIASRAGRSADEHRHAIGTMLAPFTDVAAANPYAWFPIARTADELALPSEDNRIVCEPYTKRMTAFLGSDQGAALVVCSLAAARRAGVADRAVFIWSGAEAIDVRSVTARPDPGRSPAIAAAGRALFEAAAAGKGRLRGSIGIDDIEVIDLYSCFPSAVSLGAAALGLATDDRRGLTATGGLPYFGGPGNNYTTHGIASVTDRLRKEGPAPSIDRPRLGLATGLGWFITKHALGIYGSTPPPGGFRRGNTVDDQARIDAAAVEVALDVDESTKATVVAATVIRDHDGRATGAPLIARLPDGRHVAAAPADDATTTELGTSDVIGLIGSAVVVEGSPPRYRLLEH